MNINTHRLVFNKSRGCVVAVAETARSCSECAPGTLSSPKRHRKRTRCAEASRDTQFTPLNHPLAQQERAQAAPVFIVSSIRTSTPGAIKVPNSALYRINTNPANTFVVQTDPGKKLRKKLGSERNWGQTPIMRKKLGSDSNYEKEIGVRLQL